MIKPSRKLRVCLIGCGGMGGAHLGVALETGRVEIASVVDIDENRAKAFKEKFQANRYSLDFREEMTSPDIDMAIVTTLPSQHTEIAVAALQNHKHVLCEKPISNTLESAEQVITAAKQSEGRIIIGHQLRYVEPWPTVIKELREEVIGKPLVMRMAGNQMTFGYIWQNQQKKIIDTSPLVDCGVHYVDLMLSMTGSPAVEVTAMGASLVPEMPGDHYNYGLLQVKFADGSLGYYEAGWGPMMTKNCWQIKDFSGPKGSLSVIAELDHDTPDNPPENITYRLINKRIPAANACEWNECKWDERVIYHKCGKGNSLRPMYDYFFDRITENAPREEFMESLIAAYEALKIVLAADQSVKESKRIKLTNHHFKCRKAEVL